MNRLYIFAIGGSGERVLKSLTMLLAAGTPIEANEVIPVIIDNDAESHALSDCKRILTAYGNTEGDNGVHTLYTSAIGTDPKQWPSFCHTTIQKPILLNVAGNTIGDLQSIIACPSKSNNPDEEANNNLIQSIETERELLFTDNDLTMNLTAGFVGNPNIGSVVLKSLSFTDPQFNAIYSGVQKNDGVIVIGSLFGGTGAAGFPLIVNTFNEIKDATKKPVLGGIAILPYFDTNRSKLAEGDVAIDREKYDVISETFPTKTRAALMYYDDYMKGVDYMYYVGDDRHRVYDHAVGGKAQNNRATLIELLSAMSIIDFAKQDHRDNTVYKRPIWGFTDSKGFVSNVSGITNSDIKKAIIKFQMMEAILKDNDFLKKAIGELHSEFVDNIGFTEEVRESTFTDGDIKHKFAKGLNQLIKEWDIWLNDLANDTRQLQVFDKQGVNGENITKKFFAENDYGIAKTNSKKSGGIFGFGKKETTEAVPPMILDAMLDVYKDLESNNIIKKNAAERQTLPYELLIISKALDNVINNKCSI